MSKSKFLLLGGIFTLVGIFNFSSAGSINYDDVSLNPGYNLFPLAISSDGVVDLDFSVVPGRVMASISCCDNGDINISSNTEVFDYPGNNSLYIENSSSFSCNFCVNLYSLDGGNYSFSLSSPLINPPVLSNGFNTFTPAISGIQDTTKQLIPLVVYIGIGILLVILGFIAIRWLVGFLIVKINNYFSSKRG